MNENGEPNGFGIMEIDDEEAGVRKLIGHYENFKRKGNIILFEPWGQIKAGDL